MIHQGKDFYALEKRGIHGHASQVRRAASVLTFVAACRSGTIESPTTSLTAEGGSHPDSGGASSSSGGVLEFGCDVYAQDCSDGLKCLPAKYGASPGLIEDGIESWCAGVSAAAVGLGEPCFVDPSAYKEPGALMDDCPLGALCWGIEGEPGDFHGRCESLCSGSAEVPGCPGDPFCPSHGGLNDLVCVSECDPFAQDCAFETDSCIRLSDKWACWPRRVRSRGDFQYPCVWQNDCQATFACVELDMAGTCYDNSLGGCCVPMCALDDPQADVACAEVDPASTCRAWELAPDTGVGICVP